MVPLVGYTDRFSVAPGHEIAFKVSSAAAGPYRATLVRVAHTDPNPAGPGMKYEDLSSRFAVERPSRVQPMALGSYARIDPADRLPLAGPLTVTALVWPTLPQAGEQCVVSRWDHAGGRGFALSIGPRGVIGSVGGTVVTTGRPLDARRWHRAWLVVDPAAGTLRVGQVGLERGIARGAPVEAEAVLPAGAALEAARPLLIGARKGDAVRDHLNGRIEDPMLLATAARGAESTVLDPARPPASLIAGWDFSAGIDGVDVVDVGPRRLGGTLVNLPTRGVTGARWTGREMCWRHAPREYAAIHFHADDLHDAAGTPTSCSGAGQPAKRQLRHAAPHRRWEDGVPFYVRPPLGRRERTRLHASTFTYQTYGNHARGNVDDAFRRAWPSGRPTRTTPTTIPSTAAQPTTSTRTARACSSRLGCGRCSPCVPAS